jgi:hypothetical protein
MFCSQKKGGPSWFLKWMIPFQVYAIIALYLLNQFHVYMKIEFPEITQPSDCLCVNCKEDANCGGLWNGEEVWGSQPPINPRLVFVVSHCLQPLHWLSNFTGGLAVSDIFVISKCDHEVDGAPPNARIIRLKNVGRCDHAYAYFLSKLSGITEFDIAVFLKDQRSEENIHCDGQWRSLKAMVDIASTKGFACGMKPTVSKELGAQLSVYHVSSYLMTFGMSSYNYRSELYEQQSDRFESNFSNMKDWLSFVGGNIKTDLTEVCYGGTFVATRGRILAHPKNLWERIELSRGSNIEEGHFAERSWASLLSKPLSASQQNSLIQYSTGIANLSVSYVGTLLHSTSEAEIGFRNAIISKQRITSLFT